MFLEVVDVEIPDFDPNLGGVTTAPASSSPRIAHPGAPGLGRPSAFKFKHDQPGIYQRSTTVPDASHIAALVKIFRGEPPEQPERFYRLTRDGHWLRRSRNLQFLEVKNTRMVGRVCYLDRAGR
jgi:hypothetical protein